MPLGLESLPDFLSKINSSRGTWLPPYFHLFHGFLPGILPQLCQPPRLMRASQHHASAIIQSYRSQAARVTQSARPQLISLCQLPGTKPPTATVCHPVSRVFNHLAIHTGTGLGLPLMGGATCPWWVVQILPGLFLSLLGAESQNGCLPHATHLLCIVHLAHTLAACQAVA